MKSPKCVFMLSVLLLTACYSPSRMLKQQKFDRALELYAAQYRIGQPFSDEKLKQMEYAFAQAQAADLAKVDVLLQSSEPQRWVTLHEIYQKIQQRQQLVQRSVQTPKTRRRGGTLASPQFNFVENIAELEQSSRANAANYFYEKGQNLLEIARTSADKMAAREAWYAFEEIHKKYFDAWRDAALLQREAKNLGTVRVEVNWAQRQTRAYNLPEIPSFSTEWVEVNPQYLASQSTDFQVVVDVLQMFPGFESHFNLCRTETKEIEQSVIEKRDSTGKVVERQVIYQTISAEICEHRAEKNAYAQAECRIFNTKTGKMVGTEWLDARYSDVQTCVTVSGDQRATCVSSTCFMLPSCSSDWWMLERVGDRLHNEIMWWLRQQAKTDFARF